MAIFTYVRSSQKNCPVAGLSIDEQIGACRYHMSSLGLPGDIPSMSFASDKPGVFVDNGVSAWKKPFAYRPAGGVIDNLVKPGDHIVCHHIDRMSRNLRNFCNTTYDWEKRNVYVHYVLNQINTHTAVGRFQANMAAAAAQFFSDLISERTREAMAVKRALEGDGKALRPPRAKKIPWESSEFRLERKDLQLDRRGGNIYRYERVSSNRQYTSGLGLEHQSIANIRYAHALAEKTGGTVVEQAFVDPAVSAYHTMFANRPAGKQLLDILKPGDDLVVYRLDRIWRNPGDALNICNELSKRGIFVHLINEGIRTDQEMGTEWIAVLAAMAHMESQIRSRRAKERAAMLRSQGKPTNCDAYRGFKTRITNGRKKLVVDEEKASVTIASDLLQTEYGLTCDQVKQIEIAWKVLDRELKEGKPLRTTLRDGCQQRSSSARRKNAEMIKKLVSDTVWDKLVKKAHEKIKQPIHERHWMMANFEYPFGVLKTGKVKARNVRLRPLRQ